jgi:hypothetical protein
MRIILDTTIGRSGTGSQDSPVMRELVALNKSKMRFSRVSLDNETRDSFLSFCKTHRMLEVLTVILIVR